MREPLFSGLRRGRDDCPSDYQLDRLSADELGPQDAARVRAHVESCAACARHLAESRFDAFPQLHSGALLGRIHERAAAPRGLLPRLAGWLKALQRPALALSALGAAALAVMVLRPTETGGPEGVRLKGGMVLHVHRLQGEHSQEVLSGTALSPGERLRFVVDLPREGYVAVVGVDGQGALYGAWPTAAARPGAGQRRPAGQGQVLPGAVALDDAPGRETLYLVACRAAEDAARCAARGDKDPQCPEGCALSPFVIVKERR